tara:strand:- start:6 stop:560 length:555 start_codon:yes stop_codon:yes gene_type:complete
LNSTTLPTSYFPPINYITKLKNKNIEIECFEYYKKRTIRNRAWILNHYGPQLLTVPIQRKSYSKTILKNIKIANNEWQSKHIKSIKSSYGSSPFFIYYFNDVQNILNKKHTFLIDLNYDILTFIIDTINIKTTINYNLSYKDNCEIIVNNQTKPYHQVFSEKFIQNLSILDLIFNTGPESNLYI